MAKRRAPITILFGNPNPQWTHEIRDEDGNVTQRVQRPAKHLQQSVTRFGLVASALDPEKVELSLSTDNDRQLSMIARLLGDEHRPFALAAHECEQMMAVHSGGVAPTWVACAENPELEAALAAHFDCARGEPQAVVTNAGRDALHHQHLDTAAQPAAFNYGALSTDTATPLAADTVLASELTTNGLARAQMSFAHTAGTNTSTLTHTWTYTGSTPVVVAKWANFNAASSGTMGEEDLLSATATVTASGDSCTVTFTLTA